MSEVELTEAEKDKLASLKRVFQSDKLYKLEKIATEFDVTLNIVRRWHANGDLKAFNNTKSVTKHFYGAEIILFYLNGLKPERK